MDETGIWSEDQSDISQFFLFQMNFAGDPRKTQISA